MMKLEAYLSKIARFGQQALKPVQNVTSQAAAPSTSFQTRQLRLERVEPGVPAAVDHLVVQLLLPHLPPLVHIVGLCEMGNSDKRFSVARMLWILLKNYIMPVLFCIVLAATQ